MLIRSLGLDENENSKKKLSFIALIEFIHGSAYFPNGQISTLL